VQATNEQSGFTTANLPNLHSEAQWAEIGSWGEKWKAGEVVGVVPGYFEQVISGARSTPAIWWKDVVSAGHCILAEKAHLHSSTLQALQATQESTESITLFRTGKEGLRDLAYRSRQCRKNAAYRESVDALEKVQRIGCKRRRLSASAHPEEISPQVDPILSDSNSTGDDQDDTDEVDPDDQVSLYDILAVADSNLDPLLQ